MPGAYKKTRIMNKQQKNFNKSIFFQLHQLKSGKSTRLGKMRIRIIIFKRLNGAILFDVTRGVGNIGIVFGTYV